MESLRKASITQLFAKMTEQKTYFPPFLKTRILISLRFAIIPFLTLMSNNCLNRQIDDILKVGEKIKSSGNVYFKNVDFINANRKYKKALRYLTKLHDNDLNEETEKRVLSQELPCLLNRYCIGLSKQ